MSSERKAAPNVFDTFVENYDFACGRGLSLSGEIRDYFAQQRVAYTRLICHDMAAARHIMDFGCGAGHSTPYLLEAFSKARLVGIDTSHESLGSARSRYASPRAEFIDAKDFCVRDRIDVAYSNGTFHHIEPADRHRELERIFGWLVPGGLFALWENNPWNPGTRLVMRRIPFDQDAQTLSYRLTKRLLGKAGFRILLTSFHFYFPAWLKGLRRLEPSLQRLPLGAQYCVLARKPS